MLKERVHKIVMKMTPSRTTKQNWTVWTNGPCPQRVPPFWLAVIGVRVSRQSEGFKAGRLDRLPVESDSCHTKQGTEVFVFFPLKSDYSPFQTVPHHSWTGEVECERRKVSQFHSHILNSTGRNFNFVNQCWRRVDRAAVLEQNG